MPPMSPRKWLPRFRLGVWLQLVPLLVMTIAFTLLFSLLQIVAMRTEVLKRRAESMARQQALRLAA